MGLVLTDERNYEDIADAIRAHVGTHDMFLPAEMADMIRRVSATAAPVDATTELTLANRYTVNAKTEFAPFLIADSELAIDLSVFDMTATRG